MEILHETQVFSPMDVFALYTKYDGVRIEAHENYQKRSLRNKYRIQTASGIQTLTVPLKSGKNNQMPIQQVEISYEEDWAKQHLHALRTAYGKSPFFLYYQEGLENIFRAKPRYLYDFNMTALQWVLHLTGIRLPIHETDTYLKQPLSGTAWYRDYEWPSPRVISTPAMPYVQVWSLPGTFCYHLSILDVIFCAGPGTLKILKDFSTK